MPGKRGQVLANTYEGVPVRILIVLGVDVVLCSSSIIIAGMIVR